LRENPLYISLQLSFSREIAKVNCHPIWKGAGPLYMKPMVNFDKLCEVYASDLAQGGSAKGPGEEEVAEDESPVDAKQNPLVNLIRRMLLKHRITPNLELINGGYLFIC
jgi:hypothetical protein